MTNQQIAEQYLEDANAQRGICMERFNELMADYHKYSSLAESDAGNENKSQRHLIEMSNFIKPTEITEQIELSSLVEAMAVCNKRWVITSHAPIPGVPERDDASSVMVPDHIISDLSLDAEHKTDDVNRTDRIAVTDTETGDRSHFHVYKSQSPEATREFVVRGLGNSSDEVKPHYYDHKKILLQHLSGALSENVDDVESWKSDVEAKYPEHAGKIKYSIKSEVGANHISAEVPGHDRAFGVYDLATNKGMVLSEDSSQIYMGAMVQPKDSIDPSKPFKVSGIVSDDTVNVTDEYGNKKDMLISDLVPHKIVEATDDDSSDYRETASGHKTRAHHTRHHSESDAEKEEQEKEDEKKKQEESVNVSEPTLPDDEESDESKAEAKAKMALAMKSVDELAKSMTGYNKTSMIYGLNRPAKLTENVKQIDGKWAVVSKSDPDKVLQYYKGSGEPTDAWVSSVERRVHMFEGTTEQRLSAELILAAESDDTTSAKQAIQELCDIKIAKIKAALKASVAKSM